MNVKAWAPAAIFAFLAGVATGIGGERTSLFSLPTRSAMAPKDAAQANFRAVLVDLIKDSTKFILTGVEDFQGRCNVLVTARLHDDYLEVKGPQPPVWFLPFTAIYRVDREGPGTSDVPVVYTSAFPHPRFCGD